MAAATGAMAAHYARGTHGRGQHVDVSIQQVAFSRNVNGALVWQFDRRKLKRVGGSLAYGKATVRAIWRLADGWCFHSLMTGRLGAPANQALSDWIDEACMANPLQGTDWLSYNRSTLPAETRAEWEAAIAAFFLTRTKADIAGEGLRRGINACVVNEPADVLADQHLAAREFFDTPSGLPERFAVIRQGERQAAPAIHAGKRPGPLSGVRVLDFAWALVGSITTKTLGDLGADIVKIESRTRPDLASTDQAAWNEFVYERLNPAGEHHEIWQHSGGCRAHLAVIRDTLTHEISSTAFARDGSHRKSEGRRRPGAKA